MTKIILVDGSSYLYRAFHALPALTNQKGEPTGALYGCINMLRKLANEETYDYFAIILDHPSKNFRHQLYDEYKANRKALPEELIFQLKAFPELITALGFTLISEPGVEADDVIATITEKALAKNWEVLISTGDKDLAQLVNEKVTLINTMTNQRFNVQTVMEHFAVRPDQIVDYLMLTGDSSDNIPGVEKVGPKTAAKWLNQYGTLDHLIQHQDEITGKVREYLKKAIPFFQISRQLVTLKKDVLLNLSLEDLVIQPPAITTLKELYRRYHFQTWLNELETPPLPTLQNDGQFLIGAPLFAFYILPNQQVTFAVENQVFVTENLEFIQQILAQKNSVKITFDLKKTLFFFKNLPTKIIDLNLANYVINANNGNITLEKLIKKFLGIEYQMNTFSSAIWQIYQKLPLNDNQYQLLTTLEQPLSEILFRMEQKGILIDLTYFNFLNEKIIKKIDMINEKIFSIIPYFNLNSPLQLQKILYENLKLPILKKTPKGQPSTSEENLEELKEFHPLIPLILEYRELAKLKSTYLDPLPKLLDQNHRLHTTFHQTVTVTGRLSSSDPNLQNIPIRTENGRLFRQLFIAPPHTKLLSADYSQIELRIMAHLANDPLMIEAYEQEIDLHALVAKEIFAHLPLEIGRQKGKTINFGLIYGMSSFGLAKRLGVPLKAAKDYMKFYFDRFPNVKKYMEEIQLFAKLNGYVTSLLGRKFYLPDLQAKNYHLKSAAERLAINAGIQGSAAEIIKMAMLNLNRVLSKFQSVHLLLQIHDELLLEVPDHLVPEIQTITKETMEKVIPLKVPLKVNITIGNSWKGSKTS